MKVLVLLGAAALFLAAEPPQGSIRLQVTDPSGAAAESTGTLTTPSGAIDRTFRTTSQGEATLENLPYGEYKIEIAKRGFATQTITVDLNAPTVTRTVTLALGAQGFNVDVVAATPLPGSDLNLRDIAAPVQVATQLDLEHSNALDLSDFLNRRLNGVHINEIQGNPFQPDVNYRGYSASPLLGTPQGVSVYADGVRLNQPFADVVSWDLIPKLAISEIVLMPGSNPLFGLNTLGGALSITTKDGRTNPGLSLQLSGGSFGRKNAEIEYGRFHSNGLHYYLASNLYFEDGWRESSPSNVRQFFGKIGWQRAKTSVTLSLAYANNSLTGNGLQELRFLRRNYSSVYTKPDINDNRSPFVNLTARRTLTDKLTFTGNAYYRYIQTSAFNGDLNEASLDQAVYQPSAADSRALTAAGYTGFPTSGATAANTPFPFWRCIAQALQRDEPGEKCNALLNRAYTDTHNYGFSGQVTYNGPVRGRTHQLTAGAAYDRSHVNFEQSTQLGYLNPDLSVTGINAYADGVTGGNVDNEPFDTRVNLSGRIWTASVYATDTLSITKALTLTLSGRFNQTRIDNRDRIRPGAVEGSLDGRHTFNRFNPAIGIIYSPRRSWSTYLSYGEGSRAPTSVELGCADPNRPCKLPNAMAGDPPLNQVVARTWEAGVRGNSEARLHWSAGWFRADNSNDILFVASEQTGFGYFKNFGRTRRQGAEVDLNARIWRINIGGGYTYLDATYRSAETVAGSANSASDAPAKGLDGFIHIRPGNTIPMIPHHMLKAFADYQITSKLTADLGLTAFSSTFARGNEDNLHQSDGTYYLGPGTTPGYAVMNLGARYEIHRRVQLFAQINNVLDRQYFTAAQLGPSGFTAQGAYIARPFPAVNGNYPVEHTTFYAPGAPRALRAGLRLHF